MENQGLYLQNYSYLSCQVPKSTKPGLKLMLLKHKKYQMIQYANN